MKNVRCDLITGHPTAQLIIGLLLRNPRHRIGSGRTGYYQLRVPETPRSIRWTQHNIACRNISCSGFVLLFFALGFVSSHRLHLLD